MSEEQIERLKRVAENKSARMKLLGDTVNVLQTLGETVPASLYDKMKEAESEADEANKELLK